LLKLLHPFTPFLTEELWQDIAERSPDEALIVSSWPELKPYSDELLAEFDNLKKVISEVRNFRKKQNIANKESLELKRIEHNSYNLALDPVLVKMANLSSLEVISEKAEQSYSFVIDGNEYFIPFGDQIDIESEREKISSELQYTKGFLLSVEKKLSNERFVQNAPEQVVSNEKKKKEDAENKIRLLEEQLRDLA